MSRCEGNGGTLASNAKSEKLVRLRAVLMCSVEYADERTLSFWNTHMPPTRLPIS